MLVGTTSYPIENQDRQHWKQISMYDEKDYGYKGDPATLNGTGFS